MKSFERSTSVQPILIEAQDLCAAECILKNLMTTHSNFQIRISKPGEKEFTIRVEKLEKETNEITKKQTIHIKAGLYDLFW